MSRLAKLTRPNLFFKPIQKPSDFGYYCLVGEITDWPFNNDKEHQKCKCIEKSSTTSGTEVSKSGAHSVQKGAAMRAARLYQSLGDSRGAPSRSTQAFLDCPPPKSIGDKTSTFQSLISQNSHQNN